MPGRLDLHIYSGSDYAEAITFRDEEGNTIDVRQRMFRSEVRESPGGELLSIFNIDTTDAENGVIVLSLSVTQTRVAKPGVWDLVEQVGSNRRALLHGRVRVTRGVTE